MDHSRLERGMERIHEIDGKAGQTIIGPLDGMAADIGRYVAEFVFGDIYSREGLSLQERELITVTCLLTAGGCEPQLSVHINGALNVGVTPERVMETLIQCIPYAGFPRVLNAAAVAKRVFAERNIAVKTE